MSEFLYQAKSPGHAKTERGFIEAETTTAAINQLKNRGLIILSLKPIKGKHHLGWTNIFKRKKVPLREKIIFTRQLAVMTKAGLSVVKALSSLRQQTSNHYFKEVIEDLGRSVKGGQPLSKSLHNYPQVFSEIYVSVVQAGEQTGQMAEVLLNLAEQQEKEADLISKVRGAMIYPAVILTALVGVIGIIVFFVLPSLQSIYADLGGQLPLSTRILFASTTFARHYFLYIFIAFIVLIQLIRFWVKRPRGRRFYDTVKLKLPVFGGFTKKVYMARFSSTMTLLTKASLPIMSSLQIVSKTIPNSHYEAAFHRISTMVESGRPLSQALSREPLFPPMISQLVSLGEETGNLDSVLNESARFYEAEVDTMSRNLSTLIEPILMIAMGLGVGFVVTSVISPIYKLVGQF